MVVQIDLSPELKEKVEREASARGLSLTEFVKLSLESAVAKQTSNDPLFADDAVFRDEGPTDLSANHDEYLYGDAS